MLIWLWESYLEKHELLFNTSEDLVELNMKNIESNSFAKRSALSNSNNISFWDSFEGRRAMGGDVSVSLLISLVLSNIVKVVSSDNDGVLHFCWGDHSSDDSSSDWDVSGEGTFLIYIGTTNSIVWGVEA